MIKCDNRKKKQQQQIGWNAAEIRNNSKITQENKIKWKNILNVIVDHRNHGCSLELKCWLSFMS